jgi:hypothetical protein
VIPGQEPRSGAAKQNREPKPPLSKKQEKVAAAVSPKARAVDLLKSTLAESQALADINERVLLVSTTAEMLWKYDEPLARGCFSTLVDELASLYSTAAEDKSGKGPTTDEIDRAIGVLLPVLARKDVRLADEAMKRCREVKGTALAKLSTGKTQSPQERLSLAREGLEANIDQSVALASSVLESGVPSGFPQYLYNLDKVDKSRADQLAQKAIRILSQGQVYGPAQAALLSVYVFKEHLVLQPMPTATPNGVLEFGMFTRALTLSDSSVDPVLERDYLAAAYSFLSSQAYGTGQGKASDPAFMGLCFFLVHKLSLYATRFGYDSEGHWSRLASNLEALAKQAGVPLQALEYMRGFAERLIARNNIFNFDSGAASFEQAETARDPQRRITLTVRGIWSLLQERKFDAAEEKTKSIDDRSLRQQVLDFVNFWASVDAAQRRAWDEAASRIDRIANPNLRPPLLLETARVAAAAGDRRRALEQVEEALRVVQKTDDKVDRARVMVCGASLLTDLSPIRSRDVLIEAKNAINSASRYDGKSLFVKLAAPGISTQWLLDDSDFALCIERSAKLDWDDAMAVIAALESKLLQVRGRIAACRAFL